jgi:hypothetical protein
MMELLVSIFRLRNEMWKSLLVMYPVLTLIPHLVTPTQPRLRSSNLYVEWGTNGVIQARNDIYMRRCKTHPSTPSEHLYCCY